MNLSQWVNQDTVLNLRNLTKIEIAVNLFDKCIRQISTCWNVLYGFAKTISWLIGLSSRFKVTVIEILSVYILHILLRNIVYGTPNCYSS